MLVVFEEQPCKECNGQGIVLRSEWQRLREALESLTKCLGRRDWDNPSFARSTFAGGAEMVEDKVSMKDRFLQCPTCSGTKIIRTPVSLKVAMEILNGAPEGENQ